jgi:hypothetical protein
LRKKPEAKNDDSFLASEDFKDNKQKPA